MKLLQIIVIVAFSFPACAQIELKSIPGVYEDRGVKMLKNDSTGYLFIPRSDTTKIVFIAYDYTTYRLYTRSNKLIVEGSFGGKKFVDVFYFYGKWTEFYENGVTRSEGEYLPYSYQPIGTWKYYYSNGQLRKSFSIVQVDIDSFNTFFCKAGRFLEYFENGKLKVSGWYGIGYKQGYIDHPNLKAGISKKIKAIVPFSIPVSEWLYYDELGNIVKRGYDQL